MSKSNTFETDLLNHIFNNAAITLVGDASGVLGSSTAGNLYISLHTDDPGEGGSQNTNETVYSDYLRVAVPRSAAGWTILNNKVSNAALIQFVTCGAIPATITHFGVGCSSGTGAGKLLYSGQLSSSLAVSTGIQPQFAIGELDVTED